MFISWLTPFPALRSLPNGLRQTDLNLLQTLGQMATTENLFAKFAPKMRFAGLRKPAIKAFEHNYRSLIAGDSGWIPEATIQPVEELPRFEDITRQHPPDSSLLARTVVVKLNGGLGTSMGLEGPKSLLPVKEGLTFLDIIVRQILHLRRSYGVPLRFLLMNSFSTSAGTRDYLRKFPEIGAPDALELMQSQVLKIDAQTQGPVSWPENPELEWCPPGHGDLYPSLLGSGWLDRLLAENIQFMFVANSDNLGASVDPDLLRYFADSGKAFLMEVAERTASDRKGGHLARRGDKLLLRESAQCPETDLPAFQDVQRHRFFNTNSIWLRLAELKKLLEKHGGFLPLPLIKNKKTVDPRNNKSPAVFQLETAMGSALECFPNAGAIVVPRSRFAPVKTTSDLLALRSDLYKVREDWQVMLDRDNDEPPPTIDLDPNHYKLLDQLEAKLRDGAPSLRHCDQLTVIGPVLFSSENVFRGKVKITNEALDPRALPPGEYQDCAIAL